MPVGTLYPDLPHIWSHFWLKLYLFLIETKFLVCSKFLPLSSNWRFIRSCLIWVRSYVTPFGYFLGQSPSAIFEIYIQQHRWFHCHCSIFTKNLELQLNFWWSLDVCWNQLIKHIISDFFLRMKILFYVEESLKNKTFC